MTAPTLPTFDHINFHPADHTYTAAEGQPLRNVTAIVNTLQTPFDADFHATRKAAQRGTTKEAILAEWEQTRLAAQVRGELFHQYIAGQLQGQPAPLVGAPPEMIAFNHWWEDSRSGAARLEPLRSEWVIGDTRLGIAGTLDTLFLDAHGQLVLYDWKTGKRFNTYNRFDSLAAPFSDLPDCELYRYSLQLSLYRLLLRRAGLAPISQAYVLHFPPNGGYQRHTALDFTDRLEAWLSDSATTF